MRRRTASVVVAALSLVLAVTGIAAPAQAVSDKHLRVIAVATSAHYLVYRQKLATGYSIKSPATGTLYFIGRDLKRHLLSDFDPRGNVQLADDTAVEQLGPDGTDPADPTTAKHLHWRNLGTKDEGDFTLAGTDTYANPSLHGWIVKRSPGPRPRTASPSTDC